MANEFNIDGDIGISGLKAGATPRRWVPEEGERKLRERIHRESRISDQKNLPFTFSKPKKSSRSKVVSCNNCGHIGIANINTVGKICRCCSEYSSVTEVVDE